MSGSVDQGTFRQILTRNIVLPLALGVASCTVFVALIIYIMNLNGWVYHTNIVLLKGANIERSYSDAVSSLRGYVLTENTDFLDPYNQAVNNFEHQFTDLQAEISDNPPQVHRAEELREKYRNWVAFANQVLQIQKTKGNKAAKEYIQEGSGKKIVDAFAVQMGEFRDTEDSLREVRVESQHEFVRIAMGVAIGLSILFGALIAIYGRKQLLGLSTSYEEILGKQAEQNDILNTQNWMKTAQTELADKMTGEFALGTLTDNILKYIAQFLNAKVAAIYVSNEQRIFDMKASFAYPISNAAVSTFKIGETLLGQAAKDGKIIETTSLPTEYFKISSGLGDTKPTSSLIVPIHNNKEVNAVMEFGFTEPIDAKRMEWLHLVTENIGMAIKTAKYKEHLEQLLEEVQNQAEELQSQQEELRVNNEELEEQTKLLRESQVRLESQQAELEQTNAQLEEQAQALESQADALNDKNRELNATQDDLKQKAEDLRSASQYKSEFLANMSHELRTPLNSSLILAKLLSDNKAKNLTDQQVEYAQQILNSGNDLLTLINDILDLSKVEAGKLEVSPETVPVNEFATKLEKLFAPVAEEKKINFKVVISKDAPKQIFTDSVRLEQIMKNLLSNAFKFTSSGTVTFEISKSKDYSTFVDMKVSDTGIGIARKQQDVIFEAFRQADGTTNRKFGGTGLGLSISKNLAQLLGGKIHVESEAEKGSTFTVSIPEDYAQVKKQEPHVEHKEAKENARELSSKISAVKEKARREVFVPDDREKLTKDSNVVLIVEDDAAFAKVLSQMAKDLKFACVITDMASEAYDLAVSIRPQAILLDVKLPDHSGLVVLDRLKQNFATRHIPVHMISGMDFISDALEMGAIGYALKPPKEHELKEVFEKLQMKISEGLQRVLIIEDDKVQREAIRHLIRTDRIEPTAVGSGEEALAELKKQSFNCIVVDLNLPDMSGFELIERISKLESSQNLPVIVYTGKDLTSQEEDKLRKHSKSIIVKGARSPERLLSEVTLFLHQVESLLDPTRQKMLEDLRNREKIFDNKKILVVDDDMRNVFALTAALENRGAKIVVAKNGQEALDKLNQEYVDVVLMDIMMPVMDGYKAMEEIRKQTRFNKLPIIALTAKAMKDDRELCLKAGASDYLAKPIDVEKLLSLIRVWISHKGKV